MALWMDDKNPGDKSDEKQLIFTGKTTDRMKSLIHFSKI